LRLGSARLDIIALRRAVASLAGRSGCQGRAPTRAERRS